MTTPATQPSKPVLTSITIWGGIVALAGTVLPILSGLGIVPADSLPDFTSTLNTVTALIGGITAIIGRFRAKQPITVTGK